MEIVGNLVKTAIDAIDKLTIDVNNAADTQEKELKKLLHTAKDTAFGTYYNFEKILKEDSPIDAYQKSVPIFDYNTLNKRWWMQQQQNPNITWPGKPDFFAKSSGTTGNKSKRIPVTKAYISSVKKVGFSMVKSLSNFDFPNSLFESELLMLSSSAKLDKNPNGFLEGEISGINIYNFPDWYDVFYRPGKEIAAIDDWNERIKIIAEEAPKWDIGAIAGIPSWVLMMLKAIVKKHNLKNIHEIWPNFTVYSSGGVSFETYKSAFEKICGKEVSVLDTYLASEGFFAYTAKPNTLSMKLAIEHGVYYEFIPFNKDGFDTQGNLLENPKVLTIDTVEKNIDYALVVSTCSGAWRYMIGDTLKFTNLDAYEIELTGRTKFFLNVVGSQLSEEKLDTAVLELSKKHNVDVNEYSVAALQKEGEYIHQWILVSNQNIDENLWKQELDEKLQEANKNYKVARSKALKGIEVLKINKKTYHHYLEATNKKGGQIKTPKVMSEQDMTAFIEFIQ